MSNADAQPYAPILPDPTVETDLRDQVKRRFGLAALGYWIAAALISGGTLFNTIPLALLVGLAAAVSIRHRVAGALIAAPAALGLFYATLGYWVVAGSVLSGPVVMGVALAARKNAQALPYRIGLYGGGLLTIVGISIEIARFSGAYFLVDAAWTLAYFGWAIALLPIARATRGHLKKTVAGLLVIFAIAGTIHHVTALEERSAYASVVELFAKNQGTEDKLREHRAEEGPYQLTLGGAVASAKVAGMVTLIPLALCYIGFLTGLAGVSPFPRGGDGATSERGATLNREV